jgi:hypothetical protein
MILTQLQESHFGWLAQHPLDSTVRDAWRAESGAFASKQDMDSLVQLAVLQPDLLDVFHKMLKWCYVLHVRNKSP